MGTPGAAWPMPEGLPAGAREPHGKCRPPGRRPRGIPAPAGGCSHRGAPPPILFLVAPKRECAAPGGREKALWRAPVQWPSARRGSADRCLLRFGLAFGHAMVFCEFAAAVPWRMVPNLSGWLSHCLCFSFRCRWPGGQREPVQRADEGIGPYGDAEGRPFFRGCGGCERSLAFCRDTESQRFFRETESYCFCGDADGHLFFRGYQKPSSKS